MEDIFITVFLPVLVLFVSGPYMHLLGFGQFLLDIAFGYEMLHPMANQPGSDPREMDEEGGGDRPPDRGCRIDGSGDARNAREEIKRER